MLATLSYPVPWNVAAATMRIAALMKSALESATVESIVANRIALRRLSFESAYFRVCTIDECRYRLCGITVAPRMPSAMYSMSLSRRIVVVGMNPARTDDNAGFD